MKKIHQLFLFCILLPTSKTFFAQQCSTTWISDNVSGIKSYSVALNFTLQVPPGSTFTRLGFVVAKKGVKSYLSTFNIDSVNNFNKRLDAYWSSGEAIRKAIDFSYFVFNYPADWIGGQTVYNKTSGLVKFTIPIGGRNAPSIIFNCQETYYYTPFAIFKSQPNCSAINNATYNASTGNYFSIKNINLDDNSPNKFIPKFEYTDLILNNYIANNSICLDYNTFIGSGLLPVAGGDGYNYKYLWQINIDGGGFEEDREKATDSPEGVINFFSTNLNRKVPHLLAFRRHVWQAGCPSNNSVSNSLIWTLPIYQSSLDEIKTLITLSSKSTQNEITLSVNSSAIPSALPRSYQWQVLNYPIYRDWYDWPFLDYYRYFSYYYNDWPKYNGIGNETEQITIPSTKEYKAYRCKVTFGDCNKAILITNYFNN